MTRTARLSRRFYDAFGDENTNELVGLLNTMDASYSDDLRALGESISTRFEAKLDQRTAELRAEIGALRTETLAAIAKASHETGGLRSDMHLAFERFGKEMAHEFVVAHRWTAALLIGTLATVVASLLKTFGTH